MDRIGRYKILKRLGGGGFGEVFLGEDPAIGRQVAIKVFKPKDENLIAFATSSDEEGLEILRARFLSEAKILASLENTMHIVNVLEYGETEEGAPYYVMPYLPHSLADELGRDVFDVKALEELPEDQRPRAMPMERALDLVEQVLKGLAAAHGQGLIHRDLKPSNIMLTEDGEIRIVDFGIAKAPDGQHSTVSHLGLGSRNYMAPEQRESAKHVDARADIYAAGVVAYRMLIGKLPIGRFADPNVAVPALGRAMNDLLLAMMDTDRARRPTDAADALEQFRAARASVGQEDASSDTGTWVGEGEAGVRDELKPLKARIAEVLAEQGRIPPHEREGLLALASIADLEEADLDRLVTDVIKDDKALKAKSRLIESLTRRIKANKGPLDNRAVESLDTAVQAVGWDRPKVERLMNELVAELDLSSTPTPGQKNLKSLDQSKALRINPVVAALAAMLVIVAVGWSMLQWRGEQRADALVEEQRTVQATEEDQAWAAAQSEGSIEAYTGYLSEWPNAFYQQQAEQQIAQLESEGQTTVVKITAEQEELLNQYRELVAIQLNILRLDKAADSAVDGALDAMGDLAAVRDVINASLVSLRSRSISAAAVAGQERLSAHLTAMFDSWQPIAVEVEVILDRAELIRNLADWAVSMSGKIPALQAQSDEVVRRMIEVGAPVVHVYVAARQLVLADRMLRRVSDILSGGPGAISAADALRRDAALFDRVLQGLVNGDDALNLEASRDREVLGALAEVMPLFEEIRFDVDSILTSSTDLFEAQEAVNKIFLGGQILSDKAKETEQILLESFGLLL